MAPGGVEADPPLRHVRAWARRTSPTCSARSGGWFHYSVDYRIGTRYLGEHIVDNFKREAMRQPLLRELLLTELDLHRVEHHFL